MRGGTFAFIGDISEPAGRMAGRASGNAGPGYAGQFGSPEFFASARAGDERALRTMEKQGYGLAWKKQRRWASVEREVGKDSARYAPGWSAASLKPRGLLTGRRVYGMNRAMSNFHGATLKMGLGIGAAMALLQGATAPRGHMVSQLAAGTGATAGGMLGAAVGGLMLGLPGELIGGWVGGTAGEKVGAAVHAFTDIAHSAQHLNFGGHYQDTQEAFTMRQRAVQEMSTSLLNARQYLGKEAALLHQ